MAAPSVIASTKARATRANVTPRLKNNAPDLASAITTVSTAGGAGSFASPVSSEAIHQVATNTANDSRFGTSVSRDRVVECTGIEFLRRPDKFAAADRRQHAVENARVGLLVGDGATRNSFPIAIAVSAQGCGVASAGQRRNSLPLRIRRRQQLFRLAGYRDKARNRILIGACPFFVEDVADHRGAALGPEFRQQILDAGDAPKTFCFQYGAKIPVVQRCIHFTAERLCRKQRR